MTSHERDRVREVFERALDERTVAAAQAAADILRTLARGIATVRDRFGRARRDQAIARALLRELGADDSDGGEGGA